MSTRLRDHEKWWTKELQEPDRLEWFRHQIGGKDSPDRRAFRQFVQRHGFSSVLDCGGGPAIEFDGFQDDGIEVDYTLLDVTKRFVEGARERGLKAEQGRIQKIPFPDGAFDLAYARHVLDHIPDSDVKPALEELVRVARKAVYVIFNLAPGPKAKLQRKAAGFFANRYARAEIIKTLGEIPRVTSVQFPGKILIMELGE